MDEPVHEHKRKNEGSCRSNKNDDNIKIPPAVVETTTQVDQTGSCSETNHGSDQSQPSDLAENVVLNNPKPNPRKQVDPEVKNLNYYTEEQVEQLVLKRLEAIYNEAYTKLVSDGYSREVALRGILINGHNLGDMNIVSNIVQNSISYITTGSVIDIGLYQEDEQVFGDMKVLVKNSLRVMLHMLRQDREELSKRDAMWCLLMGRFHVNIASTIEVPSSEKKGVNGDVDANADTESQNKSSTDADSGASSSSGNAGGLLDRDLNRLKAYSFRLALASQFNLNVRSFAAAYTAKKRPPPGQMQAKSSSRGPRYSIDNFPWENSCMVYLALGMLDAPGNKDGPEEPVDPKTEFIGYLVCRIKEVKEEMNDRKAWAYEKVMHAARKISDDLIEINLSKYETKEEQEAKNGKLKTDEGLTKKLMEMESNLKNANCKADQVKATVRRLENKNEEIRAEMEAFNLSLAESNKLCVEAVKKERKRLKKIAALEKQISQRKKETQDNHEKYLELQQQLIRLKKALENNEGQLKEATQSEEQATTLLREERKLKEVAAREGTMLLEAMQEEMEARAQIYQDKMKKLEQEASRVEMSLNVPESYHSPDESYPEHLSEEEVSDRSCVICNRSEACIVVLPCSDQVLCAECYSQHFNKPQARCPSCHVLATRMVRVYLSS